MSLGSLGFLGAMTALACGGTVRQSLRIRGRVPAVPRQSPQHLPREWHDPHPSPQRTLNGCGALAVGASADERQPQRRVRRPIRRACARATTIGSSATLSGDVRHS